MDNQTNPNVMNFICSIKTDRPVWIADENRLIFGIAEGFGGHNLFVDSSGIQHYLDLPYGVTVTGKELFHVYTDEENDAEKLRHIIENGNGLVEFSEGEIEYEIDDIFGHFGFKDLDGNIIIKPQYAYVGSFSHGLCPVNLNRTWYKGENGKDWYENHYGYIDAKGKTIIPFVFDEAGPFNKYGVAVVSTLESRYLIDTTGKKIEGTDFPYLCQYLDYNERYIEFSTEEYNEDERDYDIVGLYDTKERKVFIEPKNYNSFIQWSETCIEADYAMRSKGVNGQVFLGSDGKPLYPWHEGKGFDLLDRPDELMNTVVATTEFVPLGEDARAYFMKNGIKYDRKYRRGMIDKHGNTILPLEYDKIRYIKNNLYACVKYGVTYIFEYCP